MILTEQEAKLRWCPFARITEHSTDGVTSVNRWHGYSSELDPSDPPCIGSMCMAWRPYDETRGYCGLAGAPSPRFTSPRAPSRKPSPDDRRLASAERELEEITIERGASKHE